jgi:hypothetical protein
MRSESQRQDCEEVLRGKEIRQRPRLSELTPDQDTHIVVTNEELLVYEHEKVKPG